MRVVLANPPGVVEGSEGMVYHVKAGSRWPFSSRVPMKYCPYPFMLGYASALLKRDKRIQVRAVDGVAEGMTRSSWLDEIEKLEPDLLVAEVSAPTVIQDLDLLREVKEQTGSMVGVAGPFPTALPGSILAQAPWVDVCFVGEYELSLREFVDAKIDGRPSAEVRGIAYRRESSVVVTERRPLLEDLDLLPFPDREDLLGTRYHDFCLFEPNILMITSRGCCFGCIFCVERWIIYNSPVYRVRRPSFVVDEMEYCIKRFGARQFYFDDQSFTISKEHVLSICREISGRGLDVKWTCMGDAMSVTYDLLKSMAEAGCIGMKFGVETSDEETLRRIGKPLNLSRVRQVVRWMDDLGLISHATYAIGLPGESEESVKGTLDFALELNTDSVQIAMAVPFPGTPFYRQAVEMGFLKTKDWELFDGARCSVVSYPSLGSSRIEFLYNFACGEWARTRARRRLRRFLTSPRLALRKLSRVGPTSEISRILRQALRGGL